MKILILANNDVGLYQFRRELIGALLKEHKVTISLPYGSMVEPLKEMGCAFVDTPIDRRGINLITDLKLLMRYRKMLRTEKPDLVITYTIKPNVYGGIACRMAKIPYAVNITGLGTAFQKQGLLRKFVTFLYKTALKKAKVVFFENEGNRKTFVEEKIVPEGKCCRLSGAGVNLERYACAPYPVDEPVRFLFMGRIMKEKGIEELFAAMERLHKEGERCCLDVLGELEEAYFAQIQQFEKQGWLHYHGHQTDVRPFIQKAHCFVLPSYHEGMANTNLECASMGRPVITSQIPGCQEAVVDGVSGLLCNSQDVQSLYDAMKHFLGLTDEQRRAMGLAGRRHMEEVFDKKKVVEQTVTALYRKKICMVTTVAETTYSFILPIGQYYREHTDWDISVMCNTDPDMERKLPDGVRYFPVPMKRGISLGGISALREMVKIFKREQFDLVQYCTPNAAFYASTAARIAKIPVRLYCQWGMVYVTMKGFWRWFFKSIEKQICRNSTWIEPDSFGNLELCHQVGLYPADKGSVVWNGSTGGIDLGLYDLSKKAQWREEIRQKHGVPLDAVVFGFVGRITRDKGINELYAAFQALLEQRPDAWLLMIGNHEKEESIRPELRAWAEQEPHVVFCGTTNVVERYFAALDVHLLPSYREGFGSVIIEAEAMEIPVIATAIPGPLESMCPDMTGLSVKKQDVDSLLDAMLRLYDDPELRSQFGKAGRQYVAERFEQQQFFAHTMEDRKRLLGEK